MSENYGGKNLVATGHWNFTGGNGNTKKKEEIVFVIEGTSSGYTDGHIFNKLSSEFTYHIMELRNKEMVIETGGSPFSNSSNQTLKVEAHYLLVQ
ncbi:MAG: hypothetical protein JWO32_1708 [Bacteroidetes bacterium]|nr:hypothetical protein [Bacteroidota bacterium]